MTIGITLAKTMFVGKAKARSKNTHKKDSRARNIGTMTAQKIP